MRDGAGARTQEADATNTGSLAAGRPDNGAGRSSHSPLPRVAPALSRQGRPTVAHMPAGLRAIDVGVGSLLHQRTSDPAATIDPS